MKETIDTMLLYVKQKRFTKERLSEVSSVLTGTTAKKFIEWGWFMNLHHDKEAFSELIV